MFIDPMLITVATWNVNGLRARQEQFLAWLGQARANGARVLIGDPGRTYFPRDGLTFLAEYRVPTTRELEDLEIKRSSVWAL